MRLWRISNYQTLDGFGGERAPGRWHTATRGKRIVYLSEHPAVALLEALANLDGNPALMPESYQLLEIETELEAESLPAETAALPYAETQVIGDRWLAEHRSALLRVPSVPSPFSWNYLLNPLHTDAGRLKILHANRLVWDKRLFHLPAAPSAPKKTR